jgi:hypothetical protein
VEWESLVAYNYFEDSKLIEKIYLKNIFGKNVFGI